MPLSAAKIRRSKRQNEKHFGVYYTNDHERREDMQTYKLYDYEPYKTEFRAKVTGITKTEDGNTDVILDKTLFFPQEGGQSSDTGTLGGYEVLHVSIENGIIIHTLSGDACDLKPGLETAGVINWEHRFSNMQNHTAEHILSGLLHERWHSENKGFHLSDSIVTLDTEKELEASDLKKLEEEANRIVWSDLPVTCRYCEPEELKSIEYRSKIDLKENVRLVTISGVDICACCAPHVGRTGEIGIIKIIKAIRYKGGMRLTILAGKRAYEYLSFLQDSTDNISHLLSESSDKITDAVKRILDENNSLRIKLKNTEAEKLSEKISSLEKDIPDAILFTGDIDSLVQRNAVNTLAKEHKGICAVFAKNGEDSYKYILSYPGGDAREISSMLQEKLGARGGGSKEMVQGSVTAKEDQLLKLLAAL